MARKEKTIHYIYKTTCNVTSRWYVGMHSTHNLDDGYIGSGLRLRRSIRKYGIENHTKEILEFLPTREELVLREIEIVTKELVDDPMCMNLREGGIGGLSDEKHYIKFVNAGISNFEKSKEKRDLNLSLKRKDIGWLKKNGVKISNGLKNYYLNNENSFKNKNHSEETKQLMSEKKKGTGTGESNSQYGTCWITKDGTNKKIKKEDLETYLNEGWVKGRK
jgi:hypothetical protein